MKGININCKETNFAKLIFLGDKTIETRDSNCLKSLIGQRIALVATGIGAATVFGYCTLGEPIIYNNHQEFMDDVNSHRVYPGTKFAPKVGHKKYGYPIIDFESCAPYEPKGWGMCIRNV